MPTEDKRKPLLRGSNVVTSKQRELGIKFDKLVDQWFDNIGGAYTEEQKEELITLLRPEQIITMLHNNIHILDVDRWLKWEILLGVNLEWDIVKDLNEILYKADIEIFDCGEI